MPTRYDKEFKQNIINLYKQGESAAQLEGGHRMLPPLPNLLPPFAKDVAAFCQPGYH
ncbi:hypothetical protein [Lacticaseibacillus paracasei]|uniref:hypothetical protein n=1 Tax=Lacticaseibacillus paracasei TaxID=1597 RepID=UPI0013EB223A|nr:hypothetical protein [Lacticaseibacillus paracasei]